MINPLDFDYKLPPELIANAPTQYRDHCRLLTLNKNTGAIGHKHFYDLLDILTQNDVLVLNQTKVFPARIYGHKSTGGKVEILLLEQLTGSIWRALAHPGLKKGTSLVFDQNLHGVVIEFYQNTGEVDVEFNQGGADMFATLHQIGHTPIPPYIHSVQSEVELRSSYQTVFAKNIGSAAAPTAGLHFTSELIQKLKDKNVSIEYVTLHVGLGTFQSLKEENLISGKLHHESYLIDPETAVRLQKYKLEKKRIIAVGTTTVRTLESYAITGLTSGSTDLFIYPPYVFRYVNGLITNFHLPQSSLLMLVSSLAPSVLDAYKEAIILKYRFFSFGDAMLIY